MCVGGIIWWSEGGVINGRRMSTMSAGVVNMFLIRSDGDGRKVFISENSEPKGWRFDVFIGGIIWWREQDRREMNGRKMSTMSA